MRKFIQKARSDFFFFFIKKIYHNLLIFVFESIMFPTIFALSIKGLGGLTQKASAILMMTPIGGAIGTVLMGMAADMHNMTFSFLVPLTAFAVILIYAVVLLRKKPE